MSIFDGNMPYTNFHELNLDWVIKRMRELIIEYGKMTAKIDELEKYIVDYFKNLDIDDRIKIIIEEMAESGELEQILLDALAEKSYFVSLGDYDSGLGNCNIIHQNGLAFVFDIGYTTTAKTLRDYIKDNDLTVVGLSISHYHNDHIGTDDCSGLSAFLNDADIEFAEDFKVYLPHNNIDWTRVYNNGILTPLETLAKSVITSAGFPMVYPTENTKVEFAGYSVKFNNLSSEKFSIYYLKGITGVGNVREGYTDNAQYNDFSMIATIDTMGKRIIVPGDIQEMAERANREVLAYPDIYVIEHHDGNYTADVNFLNNLSPKIAIVQSWNTNKRAKNAMFWTRATAYHCLNKGAQIYHTNQSGTVTMELSLGGIRTTSRDENNTNFDGLYSPGLGIVKGTSIDDMLVPGKYLTTQATVFLEDLPDPFDGVSDIGVEVSIPTIGGRPLQQTVYKLLPPYLVAKRFLEDADDDTTWTEWYYYGEGQIMLKRLTNDSEEWAVEVDNVNNIYSFISANGSHCTVSFAVTVNITDADTILLNTGIPYIHSGYVYTIGNVINTTNGDLALIRVINNGGQYAIAVHDVTEGRLVGSLTFPIFSV